MRPNINRHIGQSDRAPEDRPNSKLSSHTYEKICKIGKGTYGVVYKVKDLITKEIVAMKKIKFDDKDESTPCTALREIAILKALRHENIVRLLRVEHNLSARKLYLFFEFLDCDLQRLIQDNQLTYGYVRSISEQLLVGVKYMHERLILHRDIKPHNLLVCQKSGTLKIADFGLGRPFCLPIGSLTPEIQTLWYRAPELLLGAQTYTTSVDMWAVGCVIAEMVLGKALFCEKSEIGQLFVIFRILGTPNRSHYLGSLPYYGSHLPQYSEPILTSLFSGVDDRLVSLIEGLIQLDPKDRLSANQALKSPYFF